MFWKMACIKFMLSMMTIWLANGQRAKPGDFPWRLRITVSNDSEIFRGSLKLDVYFEEKSDQHKSLIVDEASYTPGSIHVSLQKLTESGMSNIIPKIVISAFVDNCTDHWNKSLTIRAMSLTSFHKKKIFKRRFDEQNPLRLIAQCGDKNETRNGSDQEVIRDMGSFQSNDCYYQGEFYDADETFNIGCEMKCHCREGMVDCDSMCKPVQIPLPRSCRMASIDRRCCDETECMEDAIWDSCPVHTAARDKMPPWAVILHISKNENNTEYNSTCGASIIHKRLLLTSAYCVSSSNAQSITQNQFDVSVSPSISNTSLIARSKSIHIHPAYNKKDGSADLALIELSQDLEFDENMRRVNLPWPTLCKRYVVSGCALQYTTVDNFDAYISRVVPASKFCPSISTYSLQQQQPFLKIENGTEPMFCMQKMTDGLGVKNVQKSALDHNAGICNQEPGNGVITKRAQYHYIVGVVAHDYGTKNGQSEKSEIPIADPVSRPDQILARNKRADAISNVDGQKSDKDGNDKEINTCNREYIPVTNLCPHIDWLKNTINEVLGRE